MKSSASQARESIANAAQEAVLAIAQAAELAKATIASAASEAVKVTNSKNVDGNNDHDILIELKTKMDSLKDDIADLKTGTSLKISQHDDAIKKNSDDIITIKTQIKTWGVSISIFWAILELVLHIFSK